MSDVLEITVGATYRAKNPTSFLTPTFRRVTNDRTVLYVSPDGVWLNYDGPAVRPGRQYPKVSVEAFRAWASHRVEEATS